MIFARKTRPSEGTPGIAASFAERERFLLVLALKATESHRECKLTEADFTLFLESGFEWLESPRILDKFRFNLNDLDPV